MKNTLNAPAAEQGLLQLEFPATKIKNIHAVVEDVTIEIIPDKVLIQGVIHKQVFFVGQDDLIHHQEERLPFSTFIEVPGAQPGMEAIVDITIEHIKAVLTPQGDAIHQKVLIMVAVEVVEWEQIELPPAEEEPLFKMEQVIGDAVEQILVEKILELDVAAIKVTEIQAQVINVQGKILPDKVIIQGEVEEQVFFIDEEGMSRHQGAIIPFSLFIDLPGAQPGMNLQVVATIEHIKSSLVEEGQILEQEIIIEFFIKVTETVQIPVNPGIGPLVRLEQVVNEGQDQFMEVEDFSLPFPAVKIREIQAEVLDISTSILQDKLLIQGVIHKQLFYIDEEDIERHQGEDVSFSHFLDLPGIAPGMNVQVIPTIEHIKKELLPNNIVHQKIVIALFAKVTETVRMQVEEGPGDLFKLLQIVGQGVKQELIVPPVIIPPIPPPLALVSTTVKEIQVEEIVLQEILEEMVPIDFPVIKIKAVSAKVKNVVVEIIHEKAIISGMVQKQIELVDTHGIVRHQKEEIPFQFLKELPPNLDPDQTIVQPIITVEHLEVNLINNNEDLHQVIILLIQLTLVESRLRTIIIDVTGPGITTVKQPVLANELVTRVDRELLLTQEIILDPPAAEIIDTQAQLLAIEVLEVLEGAFVVSGVVEKEVEYAVNLETETVVEVFDFEETILLDEAEPERLVQIEEAQIVDIQLQLAPNGDLLTQEITIQLDVVVTEEAALDVVIDVTGVLDFTTERVQFIEPPDPKVVVTDITF